MDEASDRWPRFAPKAVEAGFHSAFGFPLRLRADRIGALNLFCTTASDLEAADVRAAQELADIAAIGILQERALREANALSEQLQHALDSRVMIEQAKGIVSSQLDIDMGEAFDRLRRHSRHGNVPLREVAAATIDGELRPQDLS